MEDDKKKKVVDLFKSNAKPNPVVRRKTTPSIEVNGHSNIVGNGNTVIKTENIIHRPKIEVKTGDGVVTAEQKARLQQLVKDWMLARSAVRKSELSYAAAWSAVNKKAGVNSYHEIPADKFKAVETWLIKQTAIVHSMPSAPAKSTQWRSSRIKGIQSRCGELGIQDKRKVYMLKAFGKDSLTLLSDADVEKVYRWAMGKH